MGAELIPLALLIPLGIVVGWCRVLQTRIDRMQIKMYSKEETDKQIVLHLAPLEARMESLKETTDDIKAMLQRVLDGNK